MQTPTANAISQGIHGAYNAVDFYSTPDPIIYAPEDGTITAKVPNNGDCGNSLKMRGGTGESGFCHLEEYYVNVGQQVVRGQPLGKMGYTGLTIPTGPGGRHLHWILNRNSQWVYPMTFVNEAFIKQGGGTKMGVPNEDGWYARFRQLTRQIRGRDMSRDEFVKNIVPARDPFNAVEILSDSTEAYQDTADGDYGRQARSENWQARLQLVENDRDLNLYPMIDAARGGLGLPNTANAADITAAIERLKVTTPTDPDSVVVTKNSLWDWFKGIFDKKQ